MMHMQLDIVAWIIGWSFVGATLGFFTIRDKPHWTRLERFKEYMKSILVGIFFAFPIYAILSEKEVFTTYVNIMIAGSVAFAATDGIINIWPKFIESIGFLLRSISDKLVGRM